MAQAKDCSTTQRRGRRIKPLPQSNQRNHGLAICEQDGGCLAEPVPAPVTITTLPWKSLSRDILILSLLKIKGSKSSVWSLRLGYAARPRQTRPTTSCASCRGRGWPDPCPIRRSIGPRSRLGMLSAQSRAGPTTRCSGPHRPAERLRLVRVWGSTVRPGARSSATDSAERVRGWQPKSQTL